MAANHIHIHLHARRTRDEGPAHDPKNGQFTAGSNGGSGTVVKHQPSGTTVPHQAPMSGPSGKLPDRQDSKGRGVSSMQNVQARIDAKKAAAQEPKNKQALAFRGRHFHVTSEPSQFGGHRTKIVHADDPSKVSYLGAKGHASTEEAEAHGQKHFHAMLTGTHSGG